MELVSQTYKDNIKQLGKEIDSYITYSLNGTSYDIGSDKLISANLHYEGGILKSVMKQLDLEITNDIPLGTEIIFRFGIKVSDNNYDPDDPVAYRTNYEYINYGTFIVYSSEKLEDNGTYKLVCYDKMLNAMKDYKDKNLLTASSLTQAPASNDNWSLGTINNVTSSSYSLNGLTVTTPANGADNNGRVIVLKDANSIIPAGKKVSFSIDITGSAVFGRVRGFYKASSQYWYSNYVDIITSTVTTSNNTIRYSGSFTMPDVGGEDKSFYIALSQGKDAVTTRTYKNAMLNIEDGETVYIPKLVYPMTIDDYINEIAERIGLTFAQHGQTFVNSSKEIPSELYLDNQGNSLEYTFRDVLDELAQVTASTICINDDGELEVRYVNNTETSIDEESLKDINVNFGEMAPPINTITFKRSAETDAISLSNPVDLADNLKNEIVISGNQILNNDDRDTYLSGILTQLYGLTYAVNDFSSTGITFYELCDSYNVVITKKDETGTTIETNTYPCLMLNDEIIISQGLQEIVHTDRPEESTTDYNTTTKTDRLNKRTDLIVDKQNGSIEAITTTLQIGEDGQSQVIEGIRTTQKQNSLDIEAITSYEEIDGKQVLTGVKTKTGFTFNSKGLIIQSSKNTYKAVHNEKGEYYYDGDTPLGETTNEGSKFKNMELFGEFRYGKEKINDNAMFVDKLYTDSDGETGVGTFYNGS